MLMRLLLFYRRGPPFEMFSDVMQLPWLPTSNLTKKYLHQAPKGRTRSVRGGIARCPRAVLKDGQDWQRVRELVSLREGEGG